MGRSMRSAVLGVTGGTPALTRSMILQPIAGRPLRPCRRRGPTWLSRRWADGYTSSEVGSMGAILTTWLLTKSMIPPLIVGRRVNPCPHHEVVSPPRSSTEKFSCSVERPPRERFIRLRPTNRRPTVGAPMPQCPPPGMAWGRLRWGSASMSSRADPRPAVPPRPATRSLPPSSAHDVAIRLCGALVVALAWVYAIHTFPTMLSQTPQLRPRAGAHRYAPPNS